MARALRDSAPDWTRIIIVGGSVVGAMVTVLSVMWGVFKMVNSVTQQEERNTAIERRLSAMEVAQLKAADDLKTVTGESKSNSGRLGEMDRRFDANDVKMNEAIVATATIKRDLIEVEGQFCASDNMRNLTQSSNIRLLAAIWEKTFGQQLQTAGAFYPDVGRCKGRN